MQVRRAFDLRQDDPIDTGMNRGHQVAVAEAGRWSIHTHVAAGTPRPLGRLGNRAARRGFLGYGDRVLEIDDYGVRLESECFLDPARYVSRREQEGAVHWMSALSFHCG